MPGRIDVHHHLIPPAVAKTLQKHGIAKVGGAELPARTPDALAFVADMEVRSLADLKMFDAAAEAGIDRTHALKLFPKYA